MPRGPHDSHGFSTTRSPDSQRSGPPARPDPIGADHLVARAPAGTRSARSSGCPCCRSGRSACSRCRRCRRGACAAPPSRGGERRIGDVAQVRRSRTDRRRIACRCARAGRRPPAAGRSRRRPGRASPAGKAVLRPGRKPRATAVRVEATTLAGAPCRRGRVSRARTGPFRRSSGSCARRRRRHCSRAGGASASWRPSGSSLADVRRLLDTGGAVPPDEALLARVAGRLETAAAPRLQRVVNATGVVLHTNLGRAPLAEAAIAALADAARGAVNLELDLTTGRRGERDALRRGRSLRAHRRRGRAGGEQQRRRRAARPRRARRRAARSSCRAASWSRSAAASACRT